jgi:type IV pilus biogenesis protein PilP
MRIDRALTVAAIGSLALMCTMHRATAQTQMTSDQATSLPCSATMSTSARLQCWQDQNQVLTQELQAVQEQKKVDRETGDDHLSDKARDITVPNVQMIFGSSGQGISADLVYTDGRTLTVHTGEIVPGGFLVKEIKADPPTVVLMNNGTPYTLLMGGEGSALDNQDGETNGPDQDRGHPFTVPAPALAGYPGSGQ